MGSFVCLEKQPQSALKMSNMQTMCSSIFAGKQQRLTVHYELEWSALFLFLFLFTSLTGDVASVMKWCQLRKFPPLPQACISSRSLYKWHIQCQNPPRRGRWFLTFASPRYEFQASILSKMFLAKMINLRFGVKLARLEQSHVTALHVPQHVLSPRPTRGFENPPLLMGSRRL